MTYDEVKRELQSYLDYKRWLLDKLESVEVDISTIEEELREREKDFNIL